MTDNDKKVFIARKPDQIREVWVLVWEKTCEGAGNIVSADEGGWLMFESEDQANAARQYWGWSFSHPVKLADVLATAKGGYDNPPVELIEFDRVCELLEDRDRLQAIIDKLPKTADGVPVVPGEDTVWKRCWLGKKFIQCEIEITGPEQAGFDYVTVEQVGSCYSTREAAKAARQKGGTQ